MPQVMIVPLGPVSDKVKIQDVIRLGNRAQSYYTFQLGGSLSNLGDPQYFSEYGTDPEAYQYTTEQLAKLIATHRRDPAAHTIVGVIDNFLYDELYSSVDLKNRYIFVSTRGNDLPETLRVSGKTLVEYVLLQMAAQLLTLEYRRQVNQQCSPEHCAPPWHTEIRGCIFDYSGLSADYPRKLMAPGICVQCQNLLRENNLPPNIEQACLRIVTFGLRPRILTAAKQLMFHPLMTLLFGAWLGALFGIFAQRQDIFVYATAILVLVFFGSLAFVWWRLRNPSRDETR